MVGGLSSRQPGVQEKGAEVRRPLLHVRSAGIEGRRLLGGCRQRFLVPLLLGQACIALPLLLLRHRGQRGGAELESRLRGFRLENHGGAGGEVGG